LKGWIHVLKGGFWTLLLFCSKK